MNRREKEEKQDMADKCPTKSLSVFKIAGIQANIRFKTAQDQPFICTVQKNILSLHCKNGRIVRLFLQYGI